MAKIITFPKKKSSILCKINFFSKFASVFVPKYRNEIFNKKVQFLYNEVYQYFIDHHTHRIGEKVDFPPENYARIDAAKAVNNIINAGRVDYLYKKRKTDKVRG